MAVYTAIDKSTDYFNTKLYTGGSGDTAHTGVGFQPDLVWIKNRTQATDNHSLFDVIRGSRSWIGSNVSDAQDTSNSAYLASFDNDGFTTTDTAVVGQDGETYASWNWKANGAGSSNTDGSITSTVSANTTAGFSIVKWTGNGIGGATVGHGLGVVPQMIISKSLGHAENWAVYHYKSNATPEDYRLSLDTTDASVDEAVVWNDTAPSSTLITLGSQDKINKDSSTHVAYCFAEKQGFSKFGSYIATGTTTDSSFVYTGLKPAMVIIKKYNTTDNWYMFDNARNTYNPVINVLYPNLIDAEDIDTTDWLDLVSNGFKITTTNAGVGGGDSYIYMAFAEAPFVNSNGVPCNAR